MQKTTLITMIASLLLVTDPGGSWMSRGFGHAGFLSLPTWQVLSSVSHRTDRWQTVQIAGESQWPLEKRDTLDKEVRT
ncbi:MAG: hypothetical protein JRJ12_14305 [Deltaproteobacteria bacterium]|nr:hypothetical protein [Deltaproteobacteria bacterium]